MTESSRSSSESLRRAIRLSRRALDVEPAGLLTDYDGTISPIVAEPSLARLVDGAHGALAALAERLAVVAVITGRAALDARRMVGVDGLLVVGNHGVEWLEPEAAAPITPPGAASLARALEALLADLPPLPGVAVERKGLSATVHYRAATDRARVRAAILEALRRATPDGVELREGRMSVELRPSGLGDKGTAAAAVVARHALRGVVVMGDDVTDLDMFQAVDRMRHDGRVAAAIVAVGGADREVPPAVAAGADAVLRDPAEAAALLVALTA